MEDKWDLPSGRRLSRSEKLAGCFPPADPRILGGLWGGRSQDRIQERSLLDVGEQGAFQQFDSGAGRASVKASAFCGLGMGIGSFHFLLSVSP